MNDLKLKSIATKSVKPLVKTDTVSYAVEYMTKHKISSVVIVDDDNIPIGIFTEFDILKVAVELNGSDLLLEDVMTTNVFCVSGEIYTHDGYVLMDEKGFRHLIIVDNEKKYLGIVSEGDFLRHLGFDELSKDKIVFDFMNSSILLVPDQSSIYDIAALMEKKNCQYAIVMEQNTPKSIVSNRDIVHYYSKHKKLKQRHIEHLKHQKFHKIKKNITLQEASLMMKEHGVHQLIVTEDDGSFIGIVTRHDLLKAIHGVYFDLLIKTIEAKTEKEQMLIAHQKELEKLINYDQLTNLPNRKLLKTMLEKSASKAKRNNNTTAFVLIDLDKFQDINDSHGHSIGDELLVAISNRLSHRLRVGDTLARLGGDEFAIILECLSYESDAAKVTQNIFNTINSSFILSNGLELNIDASAGIVMIPKDSSDAEKILQYADSALNKAKNSGRSNYKFYTKEMTVSYQKKLAFELRLKTAIEKNEFKLYYQPQVHMATGRIVGVEALIRWDHPDDGLIYPNDFISIAEESILINRIGAWVIKEVCRQSKIWQDKGYKISVALNLSPNQLRYQDTMQVLDDAIDEYNINPKYLEIEITESAIMENIQKGMEFLYAIKAKGIKIAIDDFGTGYSSLAYLKRFPIDILKIDKSFVDNVPFDKDDTAITKAIVDMSKALGYSVLAEGVENEEQLNFLQGYGCEVYQGYYKSKPLRVDEFEKLFEKEM